MGGGGWRLTSRRDQAMSKVVAVSDELKRSGIARFGVALGDEVDLRESVVLMTTISTSVFV